MSHIRNCLNQLTKSIRWRAEAAFRKKILFVGKGRRIRWSRLHHQSSLCAGIYGSRDRDEKSVNARNLFI